MNVASSLFPQTSESILKKLSAGHRLSAVEGTALFAADLFALGRAADLIRNQKHPGRFVTFVVDRNISYTDICTIGCSFCAFHKLPGESGGYILSIDEILRRVEELVALGGTQVMIQGGVNPDIRTDYLIEMVKRIHQRFPSVHIHSFSAVELISLANREQIPLKDLLARLKQAGLNSIPGGGAEILVDRIRKETSPAKIRTHEWIDFMRTAHQAGFHTTATMVFGHRESLEDRICHLDEIRALQDETGGFRSFIPWTMVHKDERSAKAVASVGGLDYLKTVAISRLYLDNIPHIQAGWLTEGLRLAQTALAFGADDMGGILCEDAVMAAAGIQAKTGIREMVRCIRAAGYLPARRNTNYEIIKIDEAGTCEAGCV